MKLGIFIQSNSVKFQQKFLYNLIHFITNLNLQINESKYHITLFYNIKKIKKQLYCNRVK